MSRLSKGNAFGTDITGYVRPNGFTPSVAVLCPECCKRPSWVEEAEDGEPLDEDGYESLLIIGARCEACGRPASEWLGDK